MNKTFLKLLKIILITGMVAFISCSGVKQSGDIQPLDFRGVSQIKKGDAAHLKWEFSNADKVRITELQRNYSNYDSISVKPDSSSTYTFVATKGKDTLILNWRVYVYDELNDTEINPVESGGMLKKPSFINSQYLYGTKKYSADNTLKFHKVMRFYYPFDTKNIIRVKSIVLDEFGNYIKGYGNKESGFLTLNANIGCSESFKQTVVTGFKEFSSEKHKGMDFAVLLDNSSVASDYFPIYDQIVASLKILDSNDRFSFFRFNQNFEQVFTDMGPQNIDSDALKPDKSKGLSAIFKSLKNTIDILSNNNSGKQKAIVLISYSTDNCSIIYDRNDIIDLALKNDIPVYVIGIGNAIDSYSLNTLANTSGARYYEIEENQINDLSRILSEIAFAQKNYYQYDISVPTDQAGGCPIINTQIEFVSSNSTCRDTLLIPSVRKRHEFNYMAVASFEHRDTVVSSEYYETVKLLADVLIKNPGQSVELIGNSSIEGNDKLNYELGLKRAQQIRKMLIQYGVNPSNVRVRSDGSNNPLYYIQESYWMQYYNRRVEIRWLDPSLLPFEIIAQTYDTETEALANVEKWEERGFRTYYERYLQNNIPVYRVKIWGFSTIKEAEKVTKKLSADYGISFVVQ